MMTLAKQTTLPPQSVQYQEIQGPCSLSQRLGEASFKTLCLFLMDTLSIDHSDPEYSDFYYQFQDRLKGREWAILLYNKIHNSPIGYTKLSKNPIWTTQGYLSDVCIHHEYRHHGWGTALVQRSLCIAKAQGMKKVSLLVEDIDSNLVTFYQRLGFKICPPTFWEKLTTPEPFRPEEFQNQRAKTAMVQMTINLISLATPIPSVPQWPTDSHLETLSSKT